MGILNNFLNKQKAKARYGVSLAQLTLLEEDLVNNKDSEVDKKYWIEGIKELEWIKDYIQEANMDLEHYKAMYALYLQKYNMKE
ncbi:TPA: hypothetical protein N2D99_002429 [Clostridium botulinum]|nr:hypothetical protein [Clostridium botulinum]